MSAARFAAIWLLIAMVGAAVLLDLSPAALDVLLTAIAVLILFLAVTRLVEWFRALDLPRSDR